MRLILATLTKRIPPKPTHLVAGFLLFALSLSVTAEPFSDRGPQQVSKSSAPHYSVAGHYADMATTAAGIAAGATELNPAGAIGVGLMKIGTEIAADRLSPRDCYYLRVSARSAGFGAAAWNIAALAGASTGVGAAAAVVVTTVAYQRVVAKDALNECFFRGSGTLTVSLVRE